MTIKHKILSKDITSKQREIIKEQFPDAFDNCIDPNKFDLVLETQKEPDILYHYTTMGTLLSILNNVGKEEKKDTEKALILGGTNLENLNDEKTKPLILRGTHVEYLNDDKEFKLACIVMSEVIKEYEDTLSGVENKGIAEFLTKEWWEKVGKGMNFNFAPFITSFSKRRDSLPMWNTYADNGAGVAIGFRKSSLKKTQDNHPGCWDSYFEECYYSETDLRKYFKEICPRIYKNIGTTNSRLSTNMDLLFKDWARYFCSLKHRAYEYEKEWRLIRSCQEFCSFEIVKYQDKKGLLKPYVEYAFEKDALKEIIIGPCADKELAKKSVEMSLHKAGFGILPGKNYQVKVENSKAPFRQI
jgi:hypothetical protein